MEAGGSFGMATSGSDGRAGKRPWRQHRPHCEDHSVKIGTSIQVDCSISEKLGPGERGDSEAFLVVLAGLRYAPPCPLSARRIFSGVNGISSMRTPTASKIALAMAGIGGVEHISPTPLPP